MHRFTLHWRRRTAAGGLSVRRKAAVAYSRATAERFAHGSSRALPGRRSPRRLCRENAGSVSAGGAANRDAEAQRYGLVAPGVECRGHLGDPFRRKALRPEGVVGRRWLWLWAAAAWIEMRTPGAVPAQVRALDLGESRKDLFRRDCRLSPFLHLTAPTSAHGDGRGRDTRRSGIGSKRRSCSRRSASSGHEKTSSVGAQLAEMTLREHSPHARRTTIVPSRACPRSSPRSARTRCARAGASIARRARRL